MAGERIRLEVRERDKLGSRESRRLRGQGLIPGVLYGRGKTPHAIVVPEVELRKALTGPHGLHAILDVVLDGQKTAHASILKYHQQDALRGRITHFDLQEVKLDQAIHAHVAVELVGESPGVKQGGVLTQLVREVTVEALPLEVPDRIELDLSGLEIGGALRVSDLSAQTARVLDDPETVLVTATAPRRIVEEEEVAVEVEGEAAPPAEAAAGETPAEGESAEA